jgi:hypothetical protein
MITCTCACAAVPCVYVCVCVCVCVSLPPVLDVEKGCREEERTRGKEKVCVNAFVCVR